MTRALAAVAAIALGGLLLLAAAATWRAAPHEPAFHAPAARALDAAAQRALVPMRFSAAPPAALSNDASVEPGAVLAVIAPERGFSAADREAVRSFVQGGGLLVVADDGAAGNSLLSAFGLRSEAVLLVEGRDDWSWSTTSLHFQAASPTAIHAAPGVAFEVLAASSAESFLDRDGDAILDGDALVGPFPIAVRHAHGAGQVVVVADPDALAGATGEANAPWLADVLRLAGRPVVLVDVSGAVAEPGLTALAWLRAGAAAGSSRALLGGIVALAAAAALLPNRLQPWRAHRFRPLRFLRREAVGGPEPPASQPGWTPRGDAALALAAVGILGWSLTGSTEAALAAGACMAALGLALLVQVPAVAAERRATPHRVMEGTPLQVRLEVRSPSGARLELRETLPPEVEVTAGTVWFQSAVPGRVEQAYTLVPAVRGIPRVGPLAVRRRDLLGLRVVERKVCPATAVEVVPRSQPIRRIPFGTRRPSITLGPHKVNRAGDGTEFHALRQYQAGDPFRSVNWKASARSKDLMVNQRVHESLAELTIFLDARAIAGTGPAAQTPLARSCRAALSVATGVLRLRDRVRVVVHGDGVRRIDAGPGARQLQEITDALTTIEARGATPLRDAVDDVLAGLRPGMPVLVVSGFERDATAVEAIALLQSRGLAPWVLSPPPLTMPADGDDGGAEPEAHAVASERVDTLARLHALGVPVFEVASDVPLDDLFLLRGVT